MKLKYVVSYNTRFGAISAESKDPEDLVLTYGHLRNVAKKLDSQSKKSRHKKFKQARNNLRAGGSGETARILREVEDNLLDSEFFSKPRTTGETKKRLLKVSGRNFTSRKVSQALGILWKKRTLRRFGKRNHYTYSSSS